MPPNHQAGISIASQKLSSTIHHMDGFLIEYTFTLDLKTKLPINPKSKTLYLKSYSMFLVLYRVLWSEVCSFVCTTSLCQGTNIEGPNIGPICGPKWKHTIAGPNIGPICGPNRGPISGPNFLTSCFVLRHQIGRQFRFTIRSQEIRSRIRSPSYLFWSCSTKDFGPEFGGPIGPHCMCSNPWVGTGLRLL